MAAHLPKDEGKISVKVQGFGVGWGLGRARHQAGLWGWRRVGWVRCVGHWVALEGGYRGGQHPNSLLGTPPAPMLTVLLAQGLYEECQYLFQPQLIVQRLVNIAVLYPGYASEQSMAPHNRSCLYK